MFGCFTANGRPDWDCFLIILSGKRHDIIAWVENLINDLINIFKSINTQVLFVAFLGVRLSHVFQKYYSYLSFLKWLIQEWSLKYIYN